MVILRFGRLCLGVDPQTVIIPHDQFIPFITGQIHGLAAKNRMSVIGKGDCPYPITVYQAAPDRIRVGQNQFRAISVPVDGGDDVAVHFILHFPKGLSVAVIEEDAALMSPVIGDGDLHVPV